MLIINALRNVRNRLLSPFTQRVDVVKAKLDQITFPEKFKGTILEKWKNYWVNLAIDYNEVFSGVLREARNKPKKAAAYILTGSAAYYCAKHNPDEEDFQDRLKYFSQELSLVAEPLQNPESRDYLLSIERSYNAGLVRRLSLGVLSLYWIDNFSRELHIYRATTPHLKPDWLKFNERIVDVGFLDRFWVLNGKMLDFDINM